MQGLQRCSHVLTLTALRIRDRAWGWSLVVGTAWCPMPSCHVKTGGACTQDCVYSIAHMDWILDQRH